MDNTDIYNITMSVRGRFSVFFFVFVFLSRFQILGQIIALILTYSLHLYALRISSLQFPVVIDCTTNYTHRNMSENKGPFRVILDHGKVCMNQTRKRNLSLNNKLSHRRQNDLTEYRCSQSGLGVLHVLDVQCLTYTFH